MSEYINSLSALEKGYFYIGLAFTVFFIIQTIFTFTELGDSIGTDAEGEADFDFLGLSLPFNLFSIRSIVGFFIMFGWSGLVFSNLGLHWAVTLLIATVLGLIMMIIISLIYYMAMKLGESGNVDLNSAIGRQCEVYLVIPEKNSGMGKVHITLNGSLKEYDAITYGELLKSGDVAKVVDVLNDKLVVEKIN